MISEQFQMKFLIFGLLLLSSGGVFGTDAPTDSTSSAAPSTSPGASVATSESVTTVTGASGATSGAPGSSALPGSTVSGATDGSTQPVTTTQKPLDLTILPISNNVQPMDAKLILQHAYQLNQQILDLNAQLKAAQKDTDPNNSPFFTQLTAFSANITGQNATLQGYISQLQTLQSAQTQLDTQLNSNLDTFTCFSQSSCVTDIPTTPEPTSPGPTPAINSCTNSSKTATLDTPQTFSFNNQQNVALCVISVLASTTTNNVSVLLDNKIGGNLNGYVQLVETRTKRSVTLNTTTTGTNFTAFQQIDIYYFADPRSTIQFNFTYVEVNNCVLDCHYPNGECKVSPSGVQYCECKKCQFTGDFCENPIGDPCQSKQKRACKETTGFGQCYLNPCFDQCYACNCAANAYNPDSEQSCIAPTDGSTPAPIPPTLPPSEIVCPTTAAPTTTVSLFTSTVIPVVSTGKPASTVTGGSTVAPGGSTDGASSASTGGASSTAASSAGTTPGDAPSTSSNAPSTTSNT